MAIPNYPILESGMLTEPEIVRRSWSERLFSWPWRPWHPTKVIQVPKREVLVMNMPNVFGPGVTKTIVAHPATAARIREALNEQAE